MRIMLKNLLGRSHEALGAEIRSLEGQFYMVTVVFDESRPVLSDNVGRTLLLPSLPAANELLDEYGIGRRELVHDSPYNEMIGLDEIGIDPLRIETGRQG